MTPQRGEVWLVDLGLAAKVRPCLVLNIPFTDTERALFAIVPHTTNLWGIPRKVFVRRLGEIPAQLLSNVEATIRLWLGL